MEFDLRSSRRVEVLCRPSDPPRHTEPYFRFRLLGPTNVVMRPKSGIGHRNPTGEITHPAAIHILYSGIIGSPVILIIPRIQGREFADSTGSRTATSDHVRGALDCTRHLDILPCGPPPSGTDIGGFMAQMICTQPKLKSDLS